MVRRRAEGLRSPEAPRIALVWPAAPGATCRAPGKEGGGLAAALGQALHLLCVDGHHRKLAHGEKRVGGNEYDLQK